MATLKGLFAQEPRTTRNFLLENKQEVKSKSMSNSVKSKANADLSQRQRVVCPSRQYPLKIQLSSSKASVGAMTSKQKVKSSASLRLSGAIPLQSKRESPGNLNITSSKHVPNSEASSSFRNTVTGSQTVHYSDQENVPFKWTEVCPSLISHNICHQGVQTEDCNKETMDQNEKLEDDDMDELRSKSTPTAGNDSEVIYSSNCGIPPKDSIYKTKNEIRNKNEGGIVPKLSPRVHQVSSAETNIDMSNKQTNKLSDFENLNISTLRKPTCTKNVHEESLVHPSSYQKGVIPKYLSKRKTEQAEASARAKKIDPNCPEGHVALPDNERRETLDTILKNYNELISELNKIPVRTDTLKMKQRKIEIEKQLDKLEGGIRIFSRSKVYVKLDA